MGEKLQGNWRVLAAALFSAVLIIGAYLLARGVGTPSPVEASTESELLRVIATKDSDGDELPDWAEALYGTSPTTTDTFNLGMPDGAAVAKGLVVPKAISDIPIATKPLSSASFVAEIDSSLPPPPEEGTLTAMFAQNFLILFMKAVADNGGEDLSEAQVNDVANQTLNSLSALVAVAPPFKSAKDLTVSGSGPDALKAYAAQAEAVLMKNTTNAAKNELLYLKDAVMDNDATAFTHLASLAKVYRDSAVGIAVLPVPEELVETDLSLVNALMRMSGIITDFTRVNTDILATIFALQQYRQAAENMGAAFTRLGSVYRDAGISLPAGAPGASFVNLIDDLAKRQPAQRP